MPIPEYVKENTIEFEARDNAGSAAIIKLYTEFKFTPDPGALFNTGFVLDLALCPTCGTSDKVETLELFFTPISPPKPGYFFQIEFPKEVTFLSTGPIPCD